MMRKISIAKPDLVYESSTPNEVGRMESFGVHVITSCTKSVHILIVPRSRDWERTPPMGIEPVSYNKGLFYIRGPIWTEQGIRY